MKASTTLDFVVIGAEKSGTTLLVDRLRRSAGIALPATEVRSFRDPFYPNREPLTGHFSPDETRLKGIKHPIYLSRPEVPVRLAAHNPRIKLIALLREPVSRAIASYLHYIRHGQLPCVEPNEGIPHMLASPGAHPKYRDILQSSAYSQSVERYLQHFPRESLHIEPYEAFVTSPDPLARIFTFLNVDVPTEVWPLPHVNRGAYDWSRIIHEHALARARLIYDEAWNIIGRGDSSAIDTSQGAPSPVVVAPEIREALKQRFSAEGQRLVELGVFNADPWTSVRN